MKSGLEDRNNQYIAGTSGQWGDNVSMKSGLEDRNNEEEGTDLSEEEVVSMKSGLEDRNNSAAGLAGDQGLFRLNEVRPGRPEQSCRRCRGQ